MWRWANTARHMLGTGKMLAVVLHSYHVTRAVTAAAQCQETHFRWHMLEANRLVNGEGQRSERASKAEPLL